MSFSYAPSGGGTQPVATGSSVASAPVNLAFAQIGGAFNNHILGTQYPHALIASGGGINVSQTLNGVTAASASVTDLWTMLDRLANAIGVLNLGSSAAGSWANLAGVPAGQGVGNATAAATPNSLARRDSTGAIAFGQVTSGAHFATSPAVGTQAGQFRGAAGDPTQSILAVTNNAGTVNQWYVDNAGNTVQLGGSTAATVRATGILYAGSAITQVTDSAGLVRVAALPIVDAAHGGLGLDLTVTGNKPAARAVIGAAVSGANGDITSLTGLTTALPISEGGTGAITAALALTALGAPSVTGVGATGSWPIVAAGVSAGAVSTAMLADGAVSPAKLLAGRVTAKTTPSLLVDVAGFNDYSLAGAPIIYSGVIGLDLTTHVPAVSGNRRYVLIYVNSTAVTGVKDGALDPTSPIEPGADTDTVPLAAINLQFGQTAIQQSDILDRRTFLRRIGTASGGTGGGIPTDAPIVTYTGYGTTTKELDIMAWHEGVNTSPDGVTDVSLRYVAPSRIKPGPLQISLGDVLGSFVSPNAMLSLQASGTSLALTIFNDPIVMGTNGNWNKITTSLTTTNTAGAAGVYKLVATLTAFGGTPTLRLTQGALLTNEIELANAYYDGSAWQLYLVWWPVFQQLTCNGIPVTEATGFAQVWGATSAALVTTSYLPPSTIATQFLFLPIALKVRYRYEGTVSSSVAATRAELAVAIDSTTTINDLIWSDGQAVNTWNTISGTYEPATPLAAGGHQFLLLARGYNNSTFAAQSTTFQRLKFATELFRG